MTILDELIYRFEADPQGLEKALAGVDRKTNKLDKNLEKAGNTGDKSFKKVAKSADNAASKIEKTKTKIGGLSTALKGLVVSSVMAVAAKGLANYIDKIDTVAALTGASVKDVESFSNAIADIGGSADTALQEFDNLTRRIQQKDDVFKDLGINVTDKSTLQILKELNSQLNKMNGAKRADVFNKLGIRDKKTRQFLAQDAANMSKGLEVAFTPVADDEDLRALNDEWTKNLSALQEAFQKTFLPFQKISLEAFNEGAKELTKILNVVATKADSLGQWIVTLSGLKIFGGPIAGVLKLIRYIGLIPALFNPISLTIAGLTALWLGVQRVVERFGDRVSNLLPNAFKTGINAIKAFFKPFIDWVSAKFEGLGKDLQWAFENPLEFIAYSLGAISGFFSATADNMLDSFDNFVDSILDFFETWQVRWKDASNDGENAIKGIWNVFLMFIHDVLERIPLVGKSIADWALGPMKLEHTFGKDKTLTEGERNAAKAVEDRGKAIKEGKFVVNAMPAQAVIDRANASLGSAATASSAISHANTTNNKTVSTTVNMDVNQTINSSRADPVAVGKESTDGINRMLKKANLQGVGQ